ncbi:hypothetical protein GOP47_0028044 [Adiantum capillus-veneris]|nr:hypothetical protein GOP47_0028044 [Adiantum capillus-veneris]
MFKGIQTSVKVLRGKRTAPPVNNKTAAPCPNTITLWKRREPKPNGRASEWMVGKAAQSAVDVVYVADREMPRLTDKAALQHIREVEKVEEYVVQRIGTLLPID